MSDEGHDPLQLSDYVPGSSVALTDDGRWPGLSAEGRARLDAVLSHPFAPAWRHTTGHRLDASAIERARRPLPTTGWLDEQLAVARELPAYRNYPRPLTQLSDFPIVSREDLVADVAAFVPIGSDLSRMTQGTSSGSTGRALLIPDDVEEVARVFWMMHALVTASGVSWQPEPARLAVANLVNQRQAYTYASVVPGFGDSAMARLNLSPTQWPQRNDFLASHDPQVLSGSPASLAELLDAQLIATLHPLALFSSATHLEPALRDDLERAYGCRVFDVYGLHETRPIAVSRDGGAFAVLDRRVHVEILDGDGEPVTAGERGEIVVTAGENPLLPLVRYRTGDFGRLVAVDGRPAIADLEGREDVTFAAADGSAVPSVDVTQQLQAAGARGWTVHQAMDGAVTAVIVGADPARSSDTLAQLFGRAVTVTIVETLADLGAGKPRRYSSAANVRPRPYN